MVNGFSIVNEAEVDVFSGIILLFLWSNVRSPADVGNLISGSSAFSKSSLYSWKFSIYILVKPSLKDFQYYFANMWIEYACSVVWTFFDIALLWY